MKKFLIPLYLFKIIPKHLPGTSASSYNRRIYSAFLTLKFKKFVEPQKRAHFPQLAAGLASASENGKLPYGQRFPAACCGVLQSLTHGREKNRKLNDNQDKSSPTLKRGWPDSQRTLL